MAALAEGLYVLAIRLSPSTLTFRNAASSQIGRVTAVGLQRDSAGVWPMRVFGQYALVYLVDGAGRYRDANGVDRAVQPGDLIFVFPRLAQAYGPGRGQHWTEFFLCFDGPVFDLWERRGLLDPRQPIRHLDPVDLWLRRLEAVPGAPREVGIGPPLLEVCRLQVVLAEALAAASSPALRQTDLDWAERACALLESDLGRDLDLGSLARTMRSSYEGFRKRFTRVVGHPPARYRMLRLVDRACALLQQEGLSSKEIAARLGFVDEAHFSRRFKAVTGSSPRRFRAQFAAAAPRGAR
jgi:AraC-like DNA-binding protein